MDTMPRPRPPHLHRQVSRHGKTVWYVRIGKGPRVRIRSDFGTPLFDAQYQAAIEGLPARQDTKDGASTGSFAWLIERYRETGAWTNLSLATRRQGKTFSSTSCNRPAVGRSGRSRQRRSWRRAIAGTIRRHKRVISSTRCAAYFVGP
jgi:hypothetical protein